MATADSFENHQASREARDSIATRPSSGRRSEVMDAVQRYLSSESYRTLHEEHAKSEERSEEGEE